MIIEDKGILLAFRKHQESGYIVDCLLENHGLMKGYSRLSLKRNIITPGNIIKVVRKSRLESQLGMITIENEKSVCHSTAFDQLKNLTLSSSVALIGQLFQERENDMRIYSMLLKFILSLDFSDKSYLKNYAMLELELLGKSGFGLDLSRCAVTNKEVNLRYISPKTGRAVCVEIGLPYHDKLFALPQFIINDNLDFDLQDIYDCLKATGHFFNKYIWEQTHLKEPPPRIQLLNSLINKTLSDKEAC